MKRTSSGRRLAAVIGVLVLIAAAAGIFLGMRYSPSKEHMPLTKYFILEDKNDAALIANGKADVPEDNIPAGRMINGTPYIRWSELNKKVDDGWVYDSTEGILRYVTNDSVISGSLDSADYTVNRDRKTWKTPIVVKAQDTAYVALDFVKEYTDMQLEIFRDPNRFVIWTAGTKRQEAELKSDEGVRRYAGIKSSILEDGKDREKVFIIDTLGSWYQVLTEKGVIGCVRAKRVTKPEKKAVAASLGKREYKHKLLDKKVVLGWHQVTNTSANSGVKDVLANTKGINVISPTWFYLNDNAGGIASLASSDYVNYCHSNNIYVWGLVSNFENADVDTTAVLNTTSSRDALVNNLIAAAITYNLDGINVDIESLRNEAANGYIEFIRELSLKCEANDLVLSVDNYVPSAHTKVYNRPEQADYVDYCVVMAYDEHFSGDTEAGSNSSYTYVKDAVKNTLDEVPAAQVILGLPLYTRAWTTASDGTLSSQNIMMKDQDKLLADHKASAEWSKKYGQNYAEWEDEKGGRVQIWLEDADSLQKKMKVYKSSGIGGVAFWKLGMEPASIWDTIAAGL